MDEYNYNRKEEGRDLGEGFYAFRETVPTTAHPEFEVHILNELGIARARSLAGVFDRALTDILDLVPPGRELSIVKTKLEEACFFGKKGLAKNPENQKIEKS
jgi:hypothetical protein